mmetsp:Transcript_13928/g.21717  ORF Transcript_13928/g.21717 Transcript_13928/m.21717 type:complete len:125 (-) Transcript_13928:29-403(-)
MTLTRNRIWGNMIGGNERSGFKELRKPLMGPYLMQRYEFSRLSMMQPHLKEWGRRNYLKEKYQSRKMRIFMRGMKVGKKQEAQKMSSMSLFDMSKKTGDDDEFGQKLGESSFSDDSLGISSEDF